VDSRLKNWKKGESKVRTGVGVEKGLRKSGGRLKSRSVAFKIRKKRKKNIAVSENKGTRGTHLGATRMAGEATCWYSSPMVSFGVGEQEGILDIQPPDQKVLQYPVSRGTGT